MLRQAWQDRLRPILVINKFDRLITELKLAPVEAYHHLSQLIEQVNAVMGSFFAGERMEDDLRWREERERRLALKKETAADEAADATTADTEDEFQERDDEDIYFAPERGNVVFASAIDGWGFRVGKFAQLYASKLGIKEANFRRVLWGDFYLDPKTKRVINYKQLRGRALKPLFVQFVLENIWAVYDAVTINPCVVIILRVLQCSLHDRNPEKIAKIVQTLNLKIAPRDLKSKDSRALLSLLFSQWLSLSTCIIQATIDIVPPPSTAQLTRIPKILYPDLLEPTLEPKNKLERDLFSCNSSSDAFVMAYVSKMFAVSAKELPENKKKPITAEDMRTRAREARERIAAEEAAPIAVTEISSEPAITPEPVPEPSVPVEAEDAILGFARIYSGTIRTGESIRCILPKYNNKFPPTHPRNVPHVVNTTVEGLYTMMGRELVLVDSVAAGNVFAIKGLEGKVMRSATLCAPGENGSVEDSSADGLLNLGGVARPVNPQLN